jgi:cyanophycinase
MHYLPTKRYMKKNHKLLICFVLAVVMLPINNVLGQDSNNLKPNQTIGPEKGTLIITGDGIYGAFQDKFLELIGGADAPIIVIPTAGSSEVLSDESLEKYKQRFIKSGFNNVTVLHTRDPQEANTDEFIEPIKNAVGVIFGGGRQWRLADSYLNTKAHDEFNKLLDRGGVIAGGSAGATIQGSYLARGDSQGNTKMMGDHEVGLSFIKNVAIDQHLLKRNRQFDMFEILDNKPELLGIGIDEGTGIIVQGDTFQVIGESYVVMYDRTRWSKERDTIYKLPRGSKEFYTLKSGDKYNLKTRSVITYKNREFIQLTESELKKYCGEYQLTGTDVKSEVYIKNGSLFSKANDQIFPLFPESETRFYIPQSEVYLDFILDSSGKILKAIIPAQNQTWKKLN